MNERGGGVTRVRINADGMHAPFVSASSSTNAVRIIAIGCLVLFKAGMVPWR